MITTSRLQVTGVTGGPLRITGASLVNGAYELATAGGADYELLTERQTTMDNILFIPGIANPVSEIRQLLFGQGQPGGSWIPTLSAAMIAANSFGSGVTDILDLSGNNNPFSQTTPASRGAWFREPKRGRVNFVTPSEDFTSAAWGKAFLVTTGTPQWVFPGDGIFGSTSHKVILGLGNATASAQSSGLGPIGTVPSGVYRYSMHLKAGEVTSARFRENVSVGSFLVVDLISGVVTSGGGPGSQFVDPIVENAGNGWWRVSFTTPTMTNLAKYVVRGNQDGDGVSGIFASAAQVEPGSSTTAYQRVTTAFDVTEDGQRDCYGVRFDGLDDGYRRAMDFSSTNRMTTWAVVRKQSDAAQAALFELSSLITNPGTFLMRAPRVNGEASYDYASTGTSTANAIASPFAANSFHIVECESQISTPIVSISVNGGTPITSGASQGTGNYGAYDLFLGRRNAASIPLNGDLLGLIIAGDRYSSSIRQRIRSILSRITPTVNL
jgi:hypothetical protein